MGSVLTPEVGGYPVELENWRSGWCWKENIAGPEVKIGQCPIPGSLGQFGLSLHQHCLCPMSKFPPMLGVPGVMCPLWSSHLVLGGCDIPKWPGVSEGQIGEGRWWWEAREAALCLQQPTLQRPDRCDTLSLFTQEEAGFEIEVDLAGCIWDGNDRTKLVAFDIVRGSIGNR